jgi:hypothetical protein
MSRSFSSSPADGLGSWGRRTPRVRSFSAVSRSSCSEAPTDVTFAVLESINWVALPNTVAQGKKNATSTSKTRKTNATT